MKMNLDGYEQDIIYSTHAGFGPRLIAYLIDVLMIWCLKQIVIDPLFSLFNVTDDYMFAPIFSPANIAGALVYFLYFVLNLLYLVVLFNPSKQSIHDMLSDTIVVKEQQERLRDRLTHQPSVSQNSSL